jgi:lipopolysaccharide transport system ATP-binding protein
MKTTVEVSDYLYRRAKAEAALQGRKLKDLVEEGLRLVLEAPIVASCLLSMAATRTSDVAGDRHIRSVTLKNAQGDETGDDIIFEIELFHETPLDSPRVAICINSPSGDRIATIHTNIQQNERWSIRGTRKIRAIWKRNPLAASEYGVDVRFWGHDAEIDCFANCSTLHILPREVYGTGLLPDSKFQGYLVPDAYWEIQ